MDVYLALILLFLFRHDLSGSSGTSNIGKIAANQMILKYFRSNYILCGDTFYFKPTLLCLRQRHSIHSKNVS